MTAEFRFPIRVYFEDTDAGGIVYHSNYINFFERARTEWLRALGFEQDQLMQRGIGFVVVHLAINYAKPARFNQLIEVRTRLIELGRASMTFAQEAVIDETIYVDGVVKVVCVDTTKMKSTAIPADILEEMQRES